MGVERLFARRTSTLAPTASVARRRRPADSTFGRLIWATAESALRTVAIRRSRQMPLATRGSQALTLAVAIRKMFAPPNVRPSMGSVKSASRTGVTGQEMLRPVEILARICPPMLIVGVQEEARQTTELVQALNPRNAQVSEGTVRNASGKAATGQEKPKPAEILAWICLPTQIVGARVGGNRIVKLVEKKLNAQASKGSVRSASGTGVTGQEKPKPVEILAWICLLMLIVGVQKEPHQIARLADTLVMLGRLPEFTQALPFCITY